MGDDRDRLVISDGNVTSSNKDIWNRRQKSELRGFNMHGENERTVSLTGAGLLAIGTAQSASKPLCRRTEVVDYR